MLDIKGFLETSFIDWPGKICSVLFLPSCNLRCRYCHNSSLVLHPERYRSISLGTIFDRLRSFKGWIDGICLTGGEPTLHPDLPSLVQEIRGEGFLVKLDTNGFYPQRLEPLISGKKIDFISMDIKAPLDPFRYAAVTGCFLPLDPVLQSIRMLREGPIEYEFRITVVPGLHSFEDIREIARQLRAGPKMILQDFRPQDPLDSELQKVSPYDAGRLRELEREIQAMA